MIEFSDKKRSQQEEIMDDFKLHGKELKKLLTDLKTVNKLLGGNKVSFIGLKQLLTTNHRDEPLTIVDIGCGDGEVLRQVGNLLEKEGYKINLLGLDANVNIIKEAKTRTNGQSNITFEKFDVFSEENKLPPFDIAMCTLFLHHFENEKIVALLKHLQEKARIGVVVNDLHRSRWAFHLFKLFSSVFLKTKIARHDGLVSVARGFKKSELERYSDEIKGNHEISWKWAFRYLWVISK